MLIDGLRDGAPTQLGVAFDVSRGTCRSEIYPEYKANRSTTPDEFRGQLDLVKEVLKALNIPYVEKEGFEADDVIGTLATQAEAKGFEVLICTGDRDAFQLVSDNVTVLYPRKGVSDLGRMTPKVVEERYFATPARYPDLAALVGESSDNLPGVPGVGPKTAAKWLSQYGDLAGVVAHVDEIGGKAGDNLREHLDGVLRNRKLNRLVDDLDLPLKVEDLERRSWDREEVHTVFDGLEFRVLRERLFATFEVEKDEVEGGFDLAGDIFTADDLPVRFGDGAEGRRLSHGVVVVGGYRGGSGDAGAVALAGADGCTAHLDLTVLTAEQEAVLAGWLADPNAPKVLHDAKEQLQAEPRAGNRGTLASAADEDTAARDAMVRATAVLELGKVLAERLEETGGTDLLRDLELPLVDILARMERTGIAVDEPALAELEADFGAKMHQAQEDAWDAIGRRDVNLGSPKQLQEVLFDQLGMPKTKRTKTGYTTDADALADLFVRTEHPFLEALLRHRDTSRLRVTVEGLIKSVSADRRIHTTYIQTIAATGRLSSTDPNLQNVPIRTEEGRRIRDVFVVGEGYESLMSSDYSQIEMRIMAHLSGDEGLIEAFRTGEDLHRFVGARVFSVAPEEVTPAMRSKVKAMSYGLAYGLSAFGLSKQLTISTSEAQGLMNEYFARFGGVRDYLREVVAQARATGYTATMLGRRRYLPDLMSDNRQRREGAERMALNAPIQGSAADIIKLAMKGVDAALQAEGARSRILLQVHDELVLEVAPGERESLEELVRREMGAAVEMDVPLDVSVGVGRSWHDAAH